MKMIYISRTDLLKFWRGIRGLKIGIEENGLKIRDEERLIKGIRLYHWDEELHRDYFHKNPNGFEKISHCEISYTFGADKVYKKDDISLRGALKFINGIRCIKELEVGLPINMLGLCEGWGYKELEKVFGRQEAYLGERRRISRMSGKGCRYFISDKSVEMSRAICKKRWEGVERTIGKKGRRKRYDRMNKVVEEELTGKQHGV